MIIDTIRNLLNIELIEKNHTIRKNFPVFLVSDISSFVKLPTYGRSKNRAEGNALIRTESTCQQ